VFEIGLAQSCQHFDDPVSAGVGGVANREGMGPGSCVELARRGMRDAALAGLRRELLTRAAAHPTTRRIRQVLFHPRLPVDPRHNSKIERPALARWAAKQMPRGPWHSLPLGALTGSVRASRRPGAWFTPEVWAGAAKGAGSGRRTRTPFGLNLRTARSVRSTGSEEHTSELQSHHDLVCRLLLEKKKTKQSQRKKRRGRKVR